MTNNMDKLFDHMCMLMIGMIVEKILLKCLLKYYYFVLNFLSFTTINLI